MPLDELPGETTASASGAHKAGAFGDDPVQRRSSRRCGLIAFEVVAQKQ
jgi:hypothetical protein